MADVCVQNVAPQTGTSRKQIGTFDLASDEKKLFACLEMAIIAQNWGSSLP